MSLTLVRCSVLSMGARRDRLYVDVRIRHFVRSLCRADLENQRLMAGQFL